MKTIEITFTRKVTFNKIVEVSDKDAKRALALDGEDLQMPRTAFDGSEDWFFITEDLVDNTDVLDSADEIEDLNINLHVKRARAEKV